MTKRATVADFPIGCKVKVVARDGDDPMLARYDGRIGHVEFTGDVGEMYGGQLASVAFGPSPSHESMVFPIGMLERGRIEWIPEPTTAEPDIDAHQWETDGGRAVLETDE